MTVELFLTLQLEKAPGIPGLVVDSELFQRVEQGFVTTEKSGFQQVRGDGDIFFGLLPAFLYGSNTVADFETDIPELG